MANAGNVETERRSKFQLANSFGGKPIIGLATGKLFEQRATSAKGVSGPSIPGGSL